MAKPANKKINTPKDEQPRFTTPHMLRSKRVEKQIHLNKLKNGGKRPKRREFNSGHLTVILLCLVLVTFVSVMLWALLHKNSMAVRINDTEVAYLKDTKTDTEAFNKLILAKLKEKTGNNVQLNETVALVPVRVNSSKLNPNTEAVVAQVCEKLTYKQEAAAVTVKGQVKAILPNAQEAQALLDQILAINKPEEQEANVVEVAFSDDVKVETVFVDEDEVMTSVKASDVLRAFTNEPKTYTVQQGDSFSGIAAKADMTEADLLAANPTITRETMHKIKIGQQLNITVPVPVLSVKIVKEEKETQPVDIPVETKENPNQPKSYNKVLSQGKAGSKEVVSYVTYVNGYREGSEVVAENILVQPQPKVVEVGTKVG